MLKRILASIAMIVGASSVFAEEAPLWKTVGQWNIRVDTQLENSCFASAIYERGTALRIGFNMSSKSFNIAVADDDWRSLEYGKEYRLNIQFGSKPVWDVDFVATSFPDSNFVFLYAEATAVEFLDEFMTQHYMKISYQGSDVAILSLKGSYSAFTEVINCQRAMMGGGVRQDNNDPFQGSNKNNDDPFAR